MIRPLLFSAVAALLLSSGATAADSAHPVSAVIDGDTFTVRSACLPPPPALATVRVRGVDAPEIGSHARCPYEASLAARAAAFTAAAIAGAGRVDLVKPRRDKYGRVLATVLLDGRDLAQLLIAAELARAYDGKGQRQGWCP